MSPFRRIVWFQPSPSLNIIRSHQLPRMNIMYKIFSNYYSQTATQLMLAVFPKPPVLFQPGKTALDYPSLRQYRKTVQFVSFGNLYLRTNQLLYRRSKCLPRVTTISKDFLYHAKIIPPHVPMPPDSLFIGNIRRRCHRKSIRKTLRVNRYMPLDTANFLAGIVAFSMAVSAFCTLCASIIRKGVFSWRPCLRRAAAT